MSRDLVWEAAMLRGLTRKEYDDWQQRVLDKLIELYRDMASYDKILVDKENSMAKSYTTPRTVKTKGGSKKPKAVKVKSTRPKKPKKGGKK